MKAVLNPYLIFNGQCAEAMKFYQSVLGGKLTMQTYGESNPKSLPEDKAKIIHARLDNDLLTFMASDDSEQQRATFGNNIHLSISGADAEVLTGYFNKLAEGGKINFPLKKEFWGDIFGMLTDKFGVNWMINITSGQHAQAK